MKPILSKRRLLAAGLCAGALVAATLPAAAQAASPADFGLQVEHLLNAQSGRLFGIVRPLPAPASAADYVPREDAAAGQRILLAHGLQAEFVARNVARSGDMITFWPSAGSYTHLILCIEQGRGGATPGGNGGLNASVQRVEVDTGQVETVLHGMDRCDGIRRTAWGTVLVTEETDDGRAYEILDPLGTTDHWVADRATGDVRASVDGTAPSATVVQRQALPTMAWEGLTVQPSGVVIGGDELRPGDSALDTDGGAVFKFVPTIPFAGGAPISDLADSPLASGRAYAMTVSCREASSSRFPQYGQGCEVGVGAWVEVDALSARSEAGAHGATGYYRPEDLHEDTGYAGEGLRFCWTNTGNEDAMHYAEVMCAVDAVPLPAVPGAWIDPRTGFAYLADDGVPTTVVANRLIEGDRRFNSFDNLHVQPGTGNVYVVEDHPHGEIYACLPDGADRDLKSDGCIAVASVVDPQAEPTGFEFDGSGEVAYLVIQHGESPAALSDFASNPVDGRTDDLIRITGFRLPH